MKEIILPKIVSVGIYDAGIAEKNRAISKIRKTSMFELELPIGEGGISYIDSESHPINENTVICAKSNQLRHTRLPFKCYYIHMMVNEGELYEKLMSLPNFIDMTDTSQIRDIFSEMCENYSDGVFGNELILQSLILKLVHILYKSSPSANGKKINHGNRGIIEKTLRYIDENLTSDLKLEKLADEAKFTPSYFHRLFKASTGKTVHEYIEDQRIKKSISLLISTNMTLTEIAYECGFSSQSYFSYAFKRKMKSAPREYVEEIYEKYKK